MPHVNNVVLAGHLTRDPEVRYLQNGTAVCDLGLAINDRVKRGEEWVDEPVFVEVTLFARKAEVAGEYLSKGAPVLITGKLRFEQWEKDGQKRSKLKVVADSMQMLGSRGQASQERQEAPQEYNQAPPPPTGDAENPF